MTSLSCACTLLYVGIYSFELLQYLVFNMDGQSRLSITYSLLNSSCQAYNTFQHCSKGGENRGKAQMWREERKNCKVLL